ncbi:MAG: hypothetical protein IJ776_01660 [Paludibacteraceae bacterium]|nr:hypothetical protein [Paludibacteraceae bacterium]
MKRLILLLIVMAVGIGTIYAEKAVIDKDNCTITKDGKTFKMYGKVKIVNNFEDVKVKIVDNFEDIKVKIVSNFEGVKK